MESNVSTAYADALVRRTARSALTFRHTSQLTLVKAKQSPPQKPLASAVTSG
jgi:hypothetical protein